MSTWYYADQHNRQIGPVTAEVVRDALARGELNAASQVWREGLAQWVALSSVSAELGIPASAMPPPRRIIMAGGRPVAVQPQSNGGMWVILLVVVGFGGIMMLGILAAIAIPAYSDYTLRAKITQMLASQSELKTMVAEHWFSNEVCPHNGDEGFGEPASYATDMIQEVAVGPSKDEQHCAIEIVLRSTTDLPNGGRVTMTLHDQSWDTTTTDILPRYLPASLRNNSN